MKSVINVCNININIAAYYCYAYISYIVVKNKLTIRERCNLILHLFHQINTKLYFINFQEQLFCLLYKAKGRRKIFCA